jgi:hypothetical protein
MLLIGLALVWAESISLGAALLVACGLTALLVVLAAKSDQTKPERNEPCADDPPQIKKF